jgi:hypothetical protein
MTRDELIAKLQQHRNNDVRVSVPSEAGGLVLELKDVGYKRRGDFITLDTEEDFGPEVILRPAGGGFTVLVNEDPVYEGDNLVDLVTAIIGTLGGTVSVEARQ